MCFIKLFSFMHKLKLGLIYFLLTSFISLNYCSLSYAAEGDDSTMTMSVVTVNPSKSKTQSVPIQMYLPIEVTPEDIIDTGGLEVEFDSNKSMYYLYKDIVKLKPKETKTFNVEIRDVWIIPEERVNNLRDQSEIVIARLKNSQYYESARKLGDSINNVLDIVIRTQFDETVSRKRHIGVYRSNLKVIEQVKEDIARLERQLEIVNSLPVPEVLEDVSVKTDSPTKTTTWMIIIIIIVFVGMLGGVFFFTWHTQAHFTRDIIALARKKVFPKSDNSASQEDSNES